MMRITEEKKSYSWNRTDCIADIDFHMSLWLTTRGTSFYQTLDSWASHKPCP